MSRAILVVDTGAYTNRNRANRFIKKGRAIWTDDTQTEILFVAQYDSAQCSAHDAVLDVDNVPAPVWQLCYRTAEAPVLQPSLEWVHSRHTNYGA